MVAYTPNKGYPQPTVGGDDDVWGGYLDNGLAIVDKNLAGLVAIPVGGNADILATSVQAQNLVQKLTGVLTGNIHYILPALGGFFLVNNATTGNYTITAITSAVGSTGIDCPQGHTIAIYSDGTNINRWNYVTGNTGQILVGDPGTPSKTGIELDLSGTIGSYVATNAGLFCVFIWGATHTIGSIVGDGAGNTLYNTTSDQTLKIDDGEISHEYAGSIIDKIMPRWFRWKSAESDKSQPGFFAQQLHRVYPWAVTPGRGREGSEDFYPWGADPAKLMVVAIAELKSLRKRVKELERRK